MKSVLGILLLSAAAFGQPGATARITQKAEAFLATLDEAGRQRAVFAFDDAEQRKRWSNLPTGLFARKGIRLSDMSVPQRKAALELLANALSPEGYRKALAIMEGDGRLPPAANRQVVFGAEEYFFSFLGKPSLATPWALQFGGHHLALNLLVVGKQGILTPSHTAAQPASYEKDGKTIRPLGAENDKAFALMAALDEGQRKEAILAFEIRNLVLGPLEDGKTIQPEGLRVSKMNAKQKEMLLSLMEEWAGMVEKGAAAARMKELRSGLDQTWFAWSGSTENGQPAYFRIQGPAVVIEYAPQRDTTHIHTMYRDPANDYGKATLAK
jgi:hypothetical protein